MKLNVISPDGVIFSAETESVRVEASDGFVGIRRGCCRTLIKTVDGALFYLDGDTEKSLDVKAGFASVADDVINVFSGV